MFEVKTMERQKQTKAEWVKEALLRYEQPLVRHATRILGDEERARDVVQETFMRLCAARRADVEDRLAAWLYTVCRNRALDVRKKEGRMGSLDQARAEGIANGGASPRELVARSEAHGLVLRAIHELPVDQREAFRLKFQDHLTYREIGQVMGKSLGTVSTLITAALASVRDQVRPVEEV